MTKEQVEDLLGPPDNENVFGGGTSGQQFCDWHDGGQLIMLCFSWDFSHGGYHLSEKGFYPKTRLEKTQGIADDLLHPGRRHLP
jgi:hypothetical protein